MDLADAYASRFLNQPRRYIFLEELIYHGKKLYLKDLWIPTAEDAAKIGYTYDELLWTQDNEFYIWQYFVENELLYSTDDKLVGRFIAPAPFSRFNLELDSESPGAIGQYIGWQIVRSYMKNNATSILEMLQMEAQTILIKQNINQKIMAKAHTSKIELNVELDENRIPEKLSWTAEDGGISNAEAKAIFLSVWDAKAQESLRIDLWTKDMPVDEMKLFFHQTLVAMSDTFMRATQDEKMTATMKDFCAYFAEKLDLKKS